MASYSLAHNFVLPTNHMNEQEETDYDFTDVTLANEDHDIRAHKVILFCGSPLFKKKLVDSTV